MNLYENRIINGLLKECQHIETPEIAGNLLAQDVEIHVDHTRSNLGDLWPSVWALIIALSKQFSGTIFVHLDPIDALDGPTPFSERIIFSKRITQAKIKVGLGTPPPGGSPILWGDTRGNRISFGHKLDSKYGTANPIAGFALAGYLGFTALAQAANIPPFRERCSEKELILPFLENDPLQFFDEGIAFLGLGQLGQAYLALLYFLAKRSKTLPRVFLLDKDIFESQNEFTQILLSERKDWIGKPKTEYLYEQISPWGWRVSSEFCELQWGYRKSVEQPNIAMLGLDNFESRRIAATSGYEWFVEAGINSSFTKPRITWHSFPPSRELVRLFFPSEEIPNIKIDVSSKPFFESLRETPGQCGWLTFENVTASVPSMGLVASSYAWSEMVSVLKGQRTSVSGATYIWSPFLPFIRN